MPEVIDAFESRLGDRGLLSSLKDHVIQVEALLVYLLFAIMSLFILAATVQGRYRFLDWLVPCCFLAGTRLVVRVTNPKSSLRDRLTWGTALGGLGGAVGGAVGLIVDIGSLGVSGGAGTMIGVAAGASLGAALGGRIERRGRDDLLQQGEAFDYLYDKHTKNPRVANPELVQEALNRIQWFDKNQDGRRWYAVSDLDSFLSSP